MSTWKITDRVIEGLSSSKLSGALPAVDGSALTGVPGIIKSASDPAINTNPSGGVGTLWGNTTSGELFACSDATTDSNVWTNIGAGSGDVEPWQLGGTISGYTTCGEASAWHNEIDKFSFASGGAVSGHGNLFGGHKTLAGGASSATEGFQFGGQHINSTAYLAEKFSFASNTTGSLWGDLFVNAAGNTCAVSGETFAFVKHGPGGPTTSKYVYANDVVSVDWMDLVAGRATGGTSQY